jgi:tetratricopeptide (TPR) repeat protein
LLPADWLHMGVLLVALGPTRPAMAQTEPGRLQALAALDNPDPALRLAAMVRLSELGTAADADAVLPRLADTQPALRQFALALVWHLWGRSGDAAIDAAYTRGLALMQSGDLTGAVQVFSDIIDKRPAFAEAWNKRATLYFMLDRYEQSMRDCDEVLARIPKHFGALSGYAQMLARRGQPERALEYLERAYRINPNMADADRMIEALRRQIDTRRKNST